jgi:hypothetical protein
MVDFDGAGHDPLILSLVKLYLSDPIEKQFNVPPSRTVDLLGKDKSKKGDILFAAEFEYFQQVLYGVPVEFDVELMVPDAL